MQIEPNPMPKENDPMRLILSTMGAEVECLAELESKLGEEYFAAFLQGVVLRALWWYRKTGLVEHLEQAQFYMHRMTHFTMKSALESTKIAQQAYEIERLNLFQKLHESED
jgi:hypothetical protein